MTEYDYIDSKMTTWDKVRELSIFAAPACLFVTIILGLLDLLSYDQIVQLAIVFIALFATTMLMRYTLNEKIKRIRNEYSKLK